MLISPYWQNLIGAAFASQIDGGSLEIIADDGTTVLGTFTLSASNSSGTVTVTAANIIAAATGNAAGAIMKESGGSPNTLASGNNNSFTVVPGDQDDSADTFTETGHGLYDGQKAKLSVNLPGTTPTLNADQPIIISVSDTDTFQLLTEDGGDPVDITAAAGGDTTVTALPLIVGLAANNPQFAINQVAIATNDALSLSSWTIKAPNEIIIETT